jgi:hypothetical protein
MELVLYKESLDGSVALLLKVKQDHGQNVKTKILEIKSGDQAVNPPVKYAICVTENIF